jgi:hypothetical protein
VLGSQHQQHHYSLGGGVGFSTCRPAAPAEIYYNVPKADWRMQTSKQLTTVYYCMPPDDGRMTETRRGNNIRGQEELLR